MSMLRPVTMPVLLTDAMLELLDFHVTFELLPLPFTVARSPTVSPIAVPVLVRLRRIVGFLQPLKLYSVLLYNRRKYNVYPFLPEIHGKNSHARTSLVQTWEFFFLLQTQMPQIFPQLLCFYRLISILFFSFNRDTARARDAFDIRYS